MTDNPTPPSQNVAALQPAPAPPPSPVNLVAEDGATLLVSEAGVQLVSE